MRFFILLVVIFYTHFGFTQNRSEDYYQLLSEAFLIAAIGERDTREMRRELAEVPVDTLASYLRTDEQKTAFWVNVYNAYIQHILRKDPSVYDNKSAFFSANQLPLINRNLSFDRIEHGFLRRSQWKYGLGRVGKIFPPSFEKKLRLARREPRIHFVLNCGAASCPASVVLSPYTLEDRLKKQTRRFLQKTTTYDAGQNEVRLSALFFWFRGDFGNKRSILRMLTEYGILESGPSPKLVKDPYDWTLDLDNYILD